MDPLGWLLNQNRVLPHREMDILDKNPNCALMNSLKIFVSVNNCGALNALLDISFSRGTARYTENESNLPGFPL